MKDRILFLLKMVGILISFAIVGILLLGLVYLIPTNESTQINMEISAEKLSIEGEYPSIDTTMSSKLDNYTDSLMLLKATYSGDESVFVEASMNRSEGMGKYSPWEVLIKHYKDGEEFDSVNEYSRYWHGYLIFLKPLINLFSYNKIRIINFVVQILLVIVFIVLLIRKKQKHIIAPFLIMYGFLMPFALAKSLQFSSCFYVMMIGFFSLILIKKEDMKKIYVTFLIIGILLAFFDLLTYPLITLGVPLVVYYLMKKDIGIKNSILDSFKITISWVAGYAGMWTLKWVVGSIVTGKNLFSNAINQLLFRTSDVGENYSRFDVIGNNFNCFFNTPMNIALIVFIFVMITLIIVYLRNQKKKINIKRVLSNMVPFLIIMIMPVIWFFIVSNHSYHHYWFTNRICAITVFSLMCGLVKLAQILKNTSSVK